MTGIALVMSLAGCVVPTGDRLRIPPPHGWATPQQVGATFTDGLEIVDVTTGPVSLLEVSIIGGEEGLEVVGWQLAPTMGREQAEIQVLPGYPATDPRLGPVRLAPPATLGAAPDGQGYRLLLGLRVTRPGTWNRTGIRLEYTANHLRFVQVFPARLTVCAVAVPTPENSCSEAALPTR